MKTFITVLLVLSLSYLNCSDVAFDRISGALENFRSSIIKEQVQADYRQEADKKWCSARISESTSVLSQRTKAVKEIETHINWLHKEIRDVTRDKKARQSRINENIKTLERFRKERCDNNLNYIKSLREHKQSIHILILLRNELTEFFDEWLNNPKQKPPKVDSFIERLSRYTHLLDDGQRSKFIQLVETVRTLGPDFEVESLHNKVKSYTREKSRKIKDRRHIDNTRGELRALKTPSNVKPREYVLNLRTKVLGLINSLIKHLKIARRKLSLHELLANEHFADFEGKLLKENVYLHEKIVEDERILNKYNVELSKAESQLRRRELLRRESQELLDSFERICNEKNKYYKKETNRRNVEKKYASEALHIFVKIVRKLKGRVFKQEKNVADYKSTAEGSIKKHDDVVFY